MQRCCVSSIRCCVDIMRNALPDACYVCTVACRRTIQRSKLFHCMGQRDRQLCRYHSSGFIRRGSTSGGRAPFTAHMHTHTPSTYPLTNARAHKHTCPYKHSINIHGVDCHCDAIMVLLHLLDSYCKIMSRTSTDAWKSASKSRQCKQYSRFVNAQHTMNTSSTRKVYTLCAW